MSTTDRTEGTPDGPADLEAPTPERPEDERVPVGTAFLYGLQHILAMYAGVVSPPIIIASAAGLDARATALLVTAALFVSGLGTLHQWQPRADVGHAERLEQRAETGDEQSGRDQQRGRASVETGRAGDDDRR